MQAGPEHEMPLQQRPGALENGENFLLLRFHAATLAYAAQKTKTFSFPRQKASNPPAM
jgi:hypothetical protein